MEIKPLIPVGTKIQIDKSRIENVLDQKLMDDLPQIINGEVVDYKMTDGMSIGYVLMVDKNLKIWIFNSELNEKTKNEYKINDTNKSKNIITKALISRINNVHYTINGNRSIKSMANPINLISWLTYTLKDIF
tara:strand:+ start:430 stop:828 length:399 start_codon:yes stop_codon:yes gene_type:complete